MDFEFCQPPGERPHPLCMVAREFHSGRLIRIWLDGPSPPGQCPFACGPASLVVAYYASAELGCFLTLGWPMPKFVLDLYVEFRNSTNGTPTPCGWGLLGALATFGLPAMNSAEKESMRSLAMRGGEYTPDEQQALIDYCQTDVDSLARLLPKMMPNLDLPRALLRGRFMAAAARMERAGTPIDTVTLDRLRNNWDAIKLQAIKAVDREHGVFDGTTFKASRWESYLTERGISWPRLDSGRLALDDDTFHAMAGRYPDEVGPIRELRLTLNQLKLNDLAVGRDGRNRCLLSAFQSKTGRNQPSNSEYIFGPSCWLRALIKPPNGMATAYIDWSAQEIGIAAALSEDPAMMAAYSAGDPYLWLAKVGGYAPPEATKKTHLNVRETFKVVYLAANYGMGEYSLSQVIGRPLIDARELLRLHRAKFPVFWRWSDAAHTHAILTGTINTVFGWELHMAPNMKPNTLRNFPVQANGAEMLRLACCLGTECGIHVCAPVHDALLIEAPVSEIDQAVVEAQRAMREASEKVLGGFPLRTDAKIVRHPDRYMDARGVRMWDTVQAILAALPSSLPIGEAASMD